MTQQPKASSPPSFTGLEIVVGALVGGLVMAVVQLVLDMFFAPANFRDGQYLVTYFMWTLPFGGVAGALAASALVLMEQEKRQWAAGLCLGGGLLLGLLVAAAIPHWELQHAPVVAGFYVVAASLVGWGFACQRPEKDAPR